MPIDAWIVVVGQERCGDACVDGFRIMRTVVGTLPAFGQCRWNGKVKKFVVSRRDLTNAAETFVEASSQAESGDVRDRFRREIADDARRRENLPQLTGWWGHSDFLMT